MNNIIKRNGNEAMVLLKPFKAKESRGEPPVVSWSEYLEIAKNPNSGEGVTWKAVLL